ncbi:hypothetical protein PPYR_11533 [Photinus pyralis]|uniref:Uncharacterized protein n=1 Tax=Photinus pyralis TaxID=7054 RepID=A0A5N4ABK2_PHOPY|nr:uncharacterized protein LOC116176001 [Photinus pyralis]KAB0794694.1 hypothetical protein PPYR_11533 [Photinus pyralis]
MNSECNLNLKSLQSNSPRSGMPQLSAKLQGEQILQNALLLTEMGMDLKEQTMSGQKYVSCLRSMTLRAAKIMSVLQSSSKTFLSLAQKVLQSGLESTPCHDQTYLTVKSDYEKLLNIIEKELGEIDEIDNVNSPTSPCGTGSTVAERLKCLEEKQKSSSDNCLLPLSNSARSVKSDVDEKYPENLSRESLIDLNNVVNLPTVPEDMFTGFTNKPTRTSSLSSLKSMRKVKLFLQRASSASDEDDESSEADEHDYNKPTAGDYEEGKGVTYMSPKKIHLGNITEEAQQD